jgi:hypothetical protein
MLTSSTFGDCGDGVYVGCILHELGGKHRFLFERCTATKGVTNLRPLMPLMQAQPYIEECRNATAGDVIQWQSGKFRDIGAHSPTLTLIAAHLKHYNQFFRTSHRFTGDRPWIYADKSPKSDGKIIINRTFRYRNPNFQWKQVVDFYGDKLLFVGMPNEHEDFCNQFGYVEYKPTKDLLEAAQLIAGSLLFIGNQSVCGAIAQGLHHPIITEVAMHIPDCIFKRDNAQYCYNGEVTLPGFDKPDLKVPAVKITPGRPSTVTTPPGQWQYGPYKSYSVADLVNTVRRSDSAEDTPDLLDRILQFNVMRCPDFFIDQGAITGYKRVEQARLNAGYPPRDFRAIIGM